MHFTRSVFVQWIRSVTGVCFFFPPAVLIGKVKIYPDPVLFKQLNGVSGMRCQWLCIFVIILFEWRAHSYLQTKP